MDATNAGLGNVATWVPPEIRKLTSFRGKSVEGGAWLDEDFVVELNRDLILAFIGISGDDQAAHTTGFNGGPPVAHGLLLVVLSTRMPAYRRLVNEQEGSGVEVRITDGTYKFTAAVPIGDAVKIEFCANTWDMRERICTVSIGWRVLRVRDSRIAAEGVMNILVVRRGQK